tara:strand:+ start:549 stop:1511 length:963 start_codon:yes stop_codon:yes gene_type:complete
MKIPTLYKKNYFDNVVIVTGSLNSGKSMVAPIVSSLNKVEHLRKLIEVDQVLHLTNLKKIKREVAYFFIRHYLDKSFYEQLIGRNLNYRAGDETSIFTAKNPIELKKRAFLKRGEHVIKKHVKDKTIFCMDTHDGMMLFHLWREVNKKFKFINIFRNPIDTVNGCFNVGQGRIENILFNEIIMFKKNKNIFPLYYLKNYKEYPKKNTMDRVIDEVLFCLKKEYLNYKKYKNDKNCLFIENEDFAVNSDRNISEICKFLKTKRSNFTKKIMKRENCPREIDPKVYQEKLKKIKFLSTKKSFQKLLDFEKVFKKRKFDTLNK